MKIKHTNKAGFTLVEIMIVVAIIGLLAAIAIPNFVKARKNSQKNACIANLKQIEGAKATWAMETKQGAAAPCVMTDICGATLYIKTEPTCPTDDAAYNPNAVDVTPTCGGEGAGYAAPDTHALP